MNVDSCSTGSLEQHAGFAMLDVRDFNRRSTFLRVEFDDDLLLLEEDDDDRDVDAGLLLLL